MALTLKRLGNKFLTTIERKRYKASIKNVTNSPPIKTTQAAQIVIVSQVHHAAVNMFLVAIKSFCRFITDFSVELIDDGSLTPDDKNTLQRHIHGVTIIDIGEIDRGSCPKGGCWERLIHVISKSETHYVIQLDSDTLTIDKPNEVLTHIANNTPFLIGGPRFQDPTPVEEIVSIVRDWENQHIQVISESKLDVLSPTYIQHYARGCAGFTGFPKGRFSLKALMQISEIMAEAVGEALWKSWGTEQVTSNIMLSTCDDVEILSWPDYQNYGFPKVTDFNGVKLIHFIGSNRYSTNAYRRLSSEQIARWTR